MASPFKKFRKHQKELLIVFGILAIISFVAAPLITGITDFFAGGSSPMSGEDDEVVVEWKHGKIKESELVRMRYQHYDTYRFCTALAKHAQDNDGSPKAPLPMAATTDEALIRTMVLAKKAEDMGIVITDETIFFYLKQLCDDTVKSDAQFDKIRKDSTGSRLPHKVLMAQLRTELLARAMMMMGGSGLDAITPGESYEYYNRVSRRVRVEALPIAVLDYMSKVEKPTESQLQQLYEEGKNRYPDPNSPDPGFKRRLKRSFGYFKANFEDFETLEMAKVTPEEVKKYYDEHKEEFRELDLPGEDEVESNDKTGASNTDAAGQKPDETQPSDPTEPQPEKSSGDDSAPPPPAEKNDAKEDATAKPADDSMDASDEKPAPESKESSDEATEPAGDSQSNSEGNDVGDKVDGANQLIAFLDDDATSADDESEKATDPQPPAPSEDADTEDAPVESTQPKQPAGVEPAEDSAEDQATPKEPTTSTPDANEEDAETTEVKKAEKPANYKPLEKVEEEIRRKLVRDSARDAMNEALDSARDRIRGYSQSYKIWKVESKNDPNSKPPAEPNWNQVASELHLIYSKTKLLDELAIQQTQLGEAASWTFAGGQVQQITFADIAYQEDVPNFQPYRIRAGGFEDAEFVFWKTDEKEAYVPELKDIRPEVERAWKQREAFKLAKKEAEQRAAESKKKGGSLVEAFGEDAVRETNQFSWLSPGGGSIAMGGGNLQVSTVIGVDRPGEEFMRDVFALDHGEVGVATNQPQTYVYVVRIAEESQPEQLRRDGFFMAGRTSQAVNMIAFQQRGELAQKWVENVEKQMGVKWIREPDLMLGE